MDVALLDAMTRMDLIQAEIAAAEPSLLEVGCATGEFCHVASQRGYTVEGLDISQAGLDIAHRRYPGIRFIQGHVESLPQGERYDCITGFELVEHLPNPSSFFREASDRLKKFGVLVLSTPNYGCVGQVGADRWRGFRESFEHLYFFSREAIQRYGEREQLSMVRWFTGGDAGINAASKDILSRVLKNLAERLGLLPIIHRMRYEHIPKPIEYQRGGALHNLLVILRKD